MGRNVLSNMSVAALRSLRRRHPLGVFSADVIRDSKGVLGLGSATETLQALEHKDFVFSQQVQSNGGQRRAYGITEKGRKALATHEAKESKNETT